MTNSRNLLLFQALEQLACVMEKHTTPEMIRHDFDAITVMATANEVAHEPGSEFATELEAKAPTFVELYSQVMMRSIKEPINGFDQE